MIEPAALHPWKLNLKLAGSDLQVTGLGINSRWTTNLQIGGLADAAALHRPRRPRPGQLRLRRTHLPPRPRSHPLPRRKPARPVARHPCRRRGPGPRRHRHGRRDRPQARDHLRQHRRRCRRTSSCRASCSAPRSPTCRRPKRSSSPRPSPRSSRATAASIRSTRFAARSASIGCAIVPADVATGQKTAIGAGKYITRKLFVEVVTDGAGLFGDAGRISDDALALAAVDRLDHRPLERERAGEQGLLDGGPIWSWLNVAPFRSRMQRAGSR